MLRLNLRLLAAAATLGLISGPAGAQTVDRIVAFGDSYADDGNLFQLLGIPRPAVYPNGRFSNGTNFVDTMANVLGVPVDNFAIGGAFTGNGNINGPGIPGFVTEYQSFLAGGGPAAFPRVSGQFDANDLVVVSIGGNDARAYERSLGLAPSATQIQGLIAGAPAQAATRVNEAMAGINALVGAGARNVTFLVGDVGRLPEVRGLPVAAVGTAYANAFNSGIQARLADTAAGGVIVNYLDLTQIGNVVENNLSAFGLVSAGACPVACVTTDPGLLDKYLFYVDQVHLTSAGFAIVGQYALRQLEAPLHFQAQTDLGLLDKYLFYVDQVHLTSAGFAIVGQYALRQLEAPLHFQAQTDLGLLAATGFGATLGGRLDLSRARTGAEGGGFSVYLSGNAASRDHARTDTNLAYETDLFGITAGAEYEAGGAIVGLALNHSRPRADIISGNDIRARAWQAGLYGGWSNGSAFVQAHAGAGTVDYDIRRDAVIDVISGEAEGKALTAGAKAGYLLPLGGLRLGPIVGLHYASAEIDAFTETGDPVLTLAVGEQDVKALVGSAGLELRATLPSGDLAIRPYAALTAEKDFEGDGRTIRYAGTASPGIVNSFVLPERSKEVYGRIAAGASFALGSRAEVQIQGSGTFAHDGSDDLSGFVGLKFGF